MFSHTQNLDEQAQKLSSTSISQSVEPQPVEPSDEPAPEQPEETPVIDQPVEEPAVQSAEPAPVPDIDPIAEAEQRGFQRAMSLRITELFNRPTSGSPTFPNPDPDEAAASDIVFLSRVRRSVWD